VGQLRPAAAPSTVNSWSRSLSGTSDSHTSPSKPTPHASASPVGGQDLSTSPGAVGDQPRGVPPGYRPLVVRALGSAFLALVSPRVELVATRPPPVSRTSHSRVALPVLRRVSCWLRCSPGWTMNSSAVGSTSARAVSRTKSLVTTSFSWSTTACAVSVA
jgi:hypothetical protein